MMRRRQFLGTSAMATALLGLTRCVRASTSSRVVAPYGPLVRDPEGVLDLPKAFSYRVLSRTGDRMSDGFRVPGMPDGMAAFGAGDGRVVVIRNHELSLKTGHLGPFEDNNRYPEALDRSLSYDPGENGAPPQVGGTTTLVYDPRTGRAEKQFLSLTGTDRNCAGGPMPWGAWITGEESEDLTSARGRLHGYCFAVKADPDSGLQKAVPLKALGRFRHEAVALDPRSGILYLTEDKPDCLLYRFIPDRKNDLGSGTLQALAVENAPTAAAPRGADLRNYDPDDAQIPEGASYPVRWIDLEDIDAPKNDLRYRGYDAGAARFARGEGIYYSGGALYICCTDGGAGRRGQIYKLTPDPSRKGPDELQLFLQPEESDLLTNCDNICASPGGDLIICEDLIKKHGGKRAHLRGVTPDGRIYNLARNALNKSELAGATFSPDGKTLFVNIQSPGITLAITGPWL
ncbi:MAG: DUF839 domain-containing protein [Akkermansiaceae bacterium]|nr:DUF839 domain-containing protein [Akkermansiaceae bacterium]NNM30358.1 DUF839 domain-containing protein [Akkermansiaceae bacterium]